MPNIEGRTLVPPYNVDEQKDSDYSQSIKKSELMKAADSSKKLREYLIERLAYNDIEPIDELAKLVHSPKVSAGQKVKILLALTSYIYPSLSAVSIEHDITNQFSINMNMPQRDAMPDLGETVEHQPAAEPEPPRKINPDIAEIKAEATSQSDLFDDPKGAEPHVVLEPSPDLKPTAGLGKNSYP